MSAIAPSGLSKCELYTAVRCSLNNNFVARIQNLSFAWWLPRLSRVLELNSYFGDRRNFAKSQAWVPTKSTYIGAAKIFSVGTCPHVPSFGASFRTCIPSSAQSLGTAMMASELGPKFPALTQSSSSVPSPHFKFRHRPRNCDGVFGTWPEVPNLGTEFRQRFWNCEDVLGTRLRRSALRLQVRPTSSQFQEPWRNAE